MSSVESIERRQMVEAARRKREEEERVREETRRRIEELREESKAKQEIMKQVASQEKRKVETEKKALKVDDDACILQIRLEDGAVLKGTFKADDSLQVVYDFIQANRTDGSTDAFSLSTQYPRKTYEANSDVLKTTLQAAQLAPRGQLTVKSVGRIPSEESRASLQTLYFNKFIHSIQAKASNRKVCSLPDNPLIFVEFSTSWSFSLMDQLPAIAERLPEVYFGRLDCEKHPDIAAKYGVAKCPVFLLFKGADKIEDIKDPDLNSIEAIIRRHKGLATNSGVEAKQMALCSPCFERDEEIVGEDPYQPFLFRVKLKGSPAEGLSWTFIPQSDRVICRNPPSYDGSDKEADPNVYGTQGTFQFHLEYIGAPPTSNPAFIIPLRFEYSRSWMPFKDAVDVYSPTLTFPKAS